VALREERKGWASRSEIWGDRFHGVVVVVCSCVGCVDWVVGREWIEFGPTLGLMDLGVMWFEKSRDSGHCG